MILSNKAVLVIGTEPWYGPLVSKHHLVIELCKRNQVVYIEPAYHMGNLARGRLPQDRYPEYYHDIHPPGLTRLKPWRFPKSESFRLIERLSEGVAWTQIRAHRFSPDLIISFDPAYLFLAGHWPVPFVFYSVDTQGNTAAEARALAESDLVVAATDVLYQRYSGRTRQLRYLPHGINVDDLTAQADRVPADIAGLTRPVAMFVGAVSLHLDVALIAGIAQARPDASIVLIGPYATGSFGGGLPKESLLHLRRYPNVHLMGPRSTEQLGAYINACDIGIVPYNLRHSRVHFSYHKTLQYLALGKPVVTTCVLPANLHVPGVYVGDTRASFLSGMEKALAQQSPGQADVLRAFARQQTWDKRLVQLAEWLP